MARPVKRKIEGGRTTAKGTTSDKRASSTHAGAGAPTSSGRYTPPIPREVKVSPTWVPVLMFVLLGLGMLVILANYVSLIPGIWILDESPNNWYLIIGLTFILGGIVTATQYH
jgi:hypothetical protein